MHNYYTLSLQPDRLRAAAQPAGRARGGRVRPLGHRRRPAVPGALGRRLRVDLRVDGREPARRAVAGGCPASASGATTSAASRARPTRRSSSAGSPFGLLSSHSRLHGSDSYRVPWLFDEESVEVLRTFTQLKMRLMPYLYGQAVAASQTGVPVMRAMAAGVPGRPGLHASRPAVHAGRPAAGRAGVQRLRRDLVLPAGRRWTPPADRRDGLRPGLGP